MKAKAEKMAATAPNIWPKALRTSHVVKMIKGSTTRMAPAIKAKTAAVTVALRERTGIQATGSALRWPPMPWAVAGDLRLVTTCDPQQQCPLPQLRIGLGLSTLRAGLYLGTPHAADGPESGGLEAGLRGSWVLSVASEPDAEDGERSVWLRLWWRSVAARLTCQRGCAPRWRGWAGRPWRVGRWRCGSGRRRRRRSPATGRSPTTARGGR